MFSFPPSPFTSFGRCALWASLAAASALSATAADSPPQAVPAAAEAGTGAVESQRERNRVLQKRNPIASEYLISGELGFAPGALADGESVDFRSLLPPSGALLGSTDSTQLTASYLYHTASGRGKPGFAASLARTFGPAERPTTVQVRANLTSAVELEPRALHPCGPGRLFSRPPAHAVRPD
jgi:hypothetical protein